MKSKKNIIEISEKEVILTQEKPVEEIPKQKKVLSDSQLEALAKAREKAKERKKELAELNAKSKGLKEEKLKLDAKEYDRIQKQKELDETVKKIEVIQTPQPPPPPQKKPNTKIKIRGKAMLKTTAEGLLNIERRLALVMANIAVI